MNRISILSVKKSMKMEKVKQTILFAFIISSFLGGCSSIKLLDTWSAGNFEALIDKNILVVATSADSLVQQAYEIEIVDQLK